MATEWSDWETLRELAERHKINVRQDFKRYWVGKHVYYRVDEACRAAVFWLRVVDAPIPDDLRERYRS
jgi:hypothetical protein